MILIRGQFRIVVLLIAAWPLSCLSVLGYLLAHGKIPVTDAVPAAVALIVPAIFYPLGLLLLKRPSAPGAFVLTLFLGGPIAVLTFYSVVWIVENAPIYLTLWDLSAPLWSRTAFFRAAVAQGSISLPLVWILWKLSKAETSLGQYVLAGGVAGLGFALAEATLHYGSRLMETLWWAETRSIRALVPTWNFQEPLWVIAAAPMALPFLGSLLALAVALGLRTRRSVGAVLTSLGGFGLSVLAHASLWTHFHQDVITPLTEDGQSILLVPDFQRELVTVQLLSFAGSIALLLTASIISIRCRR